jgi:hypothetical protein
VHRLLRHLEAVEFAGAPRLLGIDDQGREVLGYIEGWVPPNLDLFPDVALLQAALLLRALHDATAGTELAAGHEVVCHNDPSPCNYVFRDDLPVAMIDFDHAAPGDRLRDVAYAGWLWVLSGEADAPPVEDQGRRLALMADAYGIGRAGLVEAIARRQTENLADALARSHSGDPAVCAYAEASAAWQRGEMAWLASVGGQLQDALLAA